MNLHKMMARIKNVINPVTDQWYCAFRTHNKLICKVYKGRFFGLTSFIRYERFLNSNDWIDENNEVISDPEIINALNAYAREKIYNKSQTVI